MPSIFPSQPEAEAATSEFVLLGFNFLELYCQFCQVKRTDMRLRFRS